MSKGAIVIGSAIALGSIWFLTRGAGPVSGTCLEIEPGQYYYFRYTGDRKTVKAALGECYPVIYTLDVYDEETDDWMPPSDPEHNILEPGSRCRIIVQSRCRLCGFIKE